MHYGRPTFAVLNPLTRSSSARAPGRDPIAIVGIGCRFPGGVDSPASFWTMLRQGVDAVGEIPRARFAVDRYFSAQPATPGKLASRAGGFLDQVEQFDPAAFGISPREAETMDPQQRLLLEVTWGRSKTRASPPTSLPASARASSLDFGSTTTRRGSCASRPAPSSIRRWVRAATRRLGGSPTPSGCLARA
jgi:hypothetical protein